jgi:hypothetical protein
LSRAQIILVAAPGAELRQSIVFALEADGFDVVSHTSLVTAMASPEAPLAASMVVDENALDQTNGHQLLEAFGRPIVLLVDKLRVVPRIAGIKVLMKPLLGRMLTETVKSTLVS